MYLPLCTWPQHPPPDLSALKFMRPRVFWHGDNFTSPCALSICLPHQCQRWTCCVCVKLFLAFMFEKTFSDIRYWWWYMMKNRSIHLWHAPKKVVTQVLTDHKIGDRTFCCLCMAGWVRFLLAANTFDLTCVPPVTSQVHLFLGLRVRENWVQENMTATALSDAGKKSRRCRFNSGSEGKISPGKWNTLGSLQPDW